VKVHHYDDFSMDGLKIPDKTIVITNLTLGSLNFDAIIGNTQLLCRQTSKSLDDARKLWENKNKILNILEEHFENSKPKEITISPFHLPLKLPLIPNDFDPRGDNHFPNPKGTIQTRGGIIYHQPSSQWVRIGLRVLGLYENDDWIKNDGTQGEWAVGFHGTNTGGMNAFSSVATTRFFGVGNAHMCENEISSAIYTKEERYGGVEEQAIYFTKHIERCYMMTVEGDGGCKYAVAFQCRINPRFFYDKDPISPSVYCVVRGSENIRPYGICNCFKY